MSSELITPIVPMVLTFIAGILGVASLFFRRGNVIQNVGTGVDDLNVDVSGRLRVRSVPVMLEEMVELPASYTNDGLRRLIKYASKVEPDHVVGINRGGVMLGASVCLAVGVESENFHKCGINKDKLICDVNFDSEGLSGKILVVDDIARTGQSLSIAIDRIAATNKSIESVYSAVLVSTIGVDGFPLYKELNHSSFFTSNMTLLLPWSDRSRSKNTVAKDQSSRIAREFREVESKGIIELATEVYRKIHVGRRAA